MTAQRHAATRRRERAPQPRAAGGDGQAAAPHGEFGGCDPILWAAEVLESLCELDRIERRALQLIYWSGLTQAQAAAELKLSEPAVRQCIARGMQQLAARLTTSGGGPWRGS
jgi:DNA-directed RNA polymerase specialized sigma24 family protein